MDIMYKYICIPAEKIVFLMKNQSIKAIKKAIILPTHCKWTAS